MNVKRWLLMALRRLIALRNRLDRIPTALLTMVIVAGWFALFTKPFTVTSFDTISAVAFYTTLTGHLFLSLYALDRGIIRRIP